MTARRRGRAAKMGRPRKPAEQVRRNRVVAMVTDAELAKLNRLAAHKRVPLGTVAYELLASALARR